MVVSLATVSRDALAAALDTAYLALTGNGHQMMSEKNSAGIARYLQGWIEKNVH